MSGNQDSVVQAPMVSIIVLTYNSGKYIGRCLQSLLLQTFNDFEVIIVDAGSTDHTYEIVISFDSRFKWLELPESDMGAARNFGMRASLGQLICFLDSDDFYLPSKLEHQVRELHSHPNVDVVFCSALHFYTNRVARLGLKKIKQQPMDLQDYLEGRNHNLSTMCMRRKVLEDGFVFGEGDRGRYGEEWRLQLSMALGGVNMAFFPDPQTVVEIRRDSHTTWSLQRIMKQQAIDEIQRAAALLTPSQRSMLHIPEIIDNFRFKLVVSLMLDGHKQEALHAAKSIDSPQKGRKARQLTALCWYFPKVILRQLLTKIWVRRLNQSFDWHSMSDSLKKNFDDVHARDNHF